MKFHSLIGAALLCAATSSHAALIHQFNLDGSLKDSITDKSLEHFGGQFVDKHYVFAPNQGLKLDAKLGGVYTIDMAFHFDTFNNYGRIVDFKNSTSDNGFYAQGHVLRLFGAGLTGKNGYLTQNVDSRVTITRDAAKMFRVYQNGELVLSGSDTDGVADFGNNVAYFFRDNTSGGNSGEANRGAVDYIRIYNTALSQDEVRTLTPPGAEIGEPATFGLLGAGLALMGWTRRQGKAKQSPGYGVFPWPGLSWLD